jgi:hypothetical protein
LTSDTTTDVAPNASAVCTLTSPIGPGARDEHPRSGAHPALAAGPDPDRQRLEQGGRVVAHAVGHGMGEGRVHRDELGERPVDGRRGEEAHVGQRL